MSRPVDAALRARWAGYLRRFAGSGLGVRGFCRDHGLSEPRFYYWRKRLAGLVAGMPRCDSTAGRMPPGRRPLFLPVRVVPEAHGDPVRHIKGGPACPVHGGRIDLLLGGVTVRLLGDVPGQRLAEVLAVLDRRGGHSC
jgi:hypothetical protein